MRDTSHSCFISVINWLLFNSCLSLLPADREWIRHYRGLWMSPLRTGMVVGGQILGVFDAHTDDLGEPAEEMSGLGGNWSQRTNQRFNGCRQTVV